MLLSSIHFLYLHDVTSLLYIFSGPSPTRFLVYTVPFRSLATTTHQRLGYIFGFHVPPRVPLFRLFILLFKLMHVCKCYLLLRSLYTSWKLLRLCELEFDNSPPKGLIRPPDLIAMKSAVFRLFRKHCWHGRGESGVQQG